jgi:hypothetical protein
MPTSAARTVPKYRPAVAHVRHAIDTIIASTPRDHRRGFIIAQQTSLNYPPFDAKDEYLRAAKLFILLDHMPEQTDTPQKCFTILECLTENGDVPGQIAEEIDRRVRNRTPRISGVVFNPADALSDVPFATILYPAAKAPRTRRQPGDPVEPLLISLITPDGAYIGFTYSESARSRPNPEDPIVLLDTPSTVPLTFEPYDHVRWGFFLEDLADAIRTPRVVAGTEPVNHG